MDNQQNCVTIVNNVIAKIKKISSDLGGDGNNEDINKLDELVNDLIRNNTTHLIHHFTEYIILFSLVLIGIFTLKKIFYKN